MPLYNGADYLAEALTTLLDQEGDVPFELLIADNASTDGSLDIAHDFAARDERVEVLASDENRGAAWNYNRLVHAARGRYFRWAAHDDRVSSNHVAETTRILEERPDVVIAHAFTIMIDEHGDKRRDYDDRLDFELDTPWDRGRTVMRHARMCNPIFGLIRLDILRQTPLIEPWPSSDVPLLFELALYGNFVMAKDALFERREHDKSSLGTSKKLSTTAVAQWFDPNSSGSRIGKDWRVAKAYVDAALRVPLTPAQRARTLAMLSVRDPEWLLRRRWRQRRVHRARAREAAARAT